MTNDLAKLVEITIDAAIRSFQPDDEGSYTSWDTELQRVESLLLEASPTPENVHLLASVRAHRIELAFEVREYELVIERSARFVREAPASHPAFFVVAIMRARCLHGAGLHEEEIREILQLTRRSELEGGEYVSLVEHLAKNHPGSLPQEKYLFDRMQEAIVTLTGLGYEKVSEVSGDTDLEHAAVQIARELRRVNREKGEALLAGSS